MNEMKWVSVEDALPKDGQAVLVCYIVGNWHADHTLADGSKQKDWRWQTAWFERGRTAAEVRASGSAECNDQAGNNLKPYCWRMFGPGKLFGQDVSHWAAITAPEAQ